VFADGSPSEALGWKNGQTKVEGLTAFVVAALLALFSRMADAGLVEKENDSEKGQTSAYGLYRSSSSSNSREARSGVAGRDSSKGLGGQTSGAPQLVAVAGVGGGLSFPLLPRSGVDGLGSTNGLGGHTDGAPHDVAVDGVAGLLTNPLAAISGVSMKETLAAEIGQERGAPQDVAVVGVSGASSMSRPAMSGDGYLETLEKVGVGARSLGPNDVQIDGVINTEPAMRFTRPPEYREFSEREGE
jgi:hypothetical protein